MCRIDPSAEKLASKGRHAALAPVWCTGGAMAGAHNRHSPAPVASRGAGAARGDRRVAHRMHDLRYRACASSSAHVRGRAREQNERDCLLYDY
eukprot:6198926-Pleurochrysis_carterae.AAC.1